MVLIHSQNVQNSLEEPIGSKDQKVQNEKALINKNIQNN